MRFAEVHPRYDDHAIITDSIASFLHVVSLEGLLADDSLYASVKTRLPLYRNYVAWKWKLTPHEAFLLRRMQERSPQSISSGQANTPSQRSVSSLPTQQFTQVSRPKRGNFFQRLFGRFKKKEDTTSPASAATQQKPRPLSRFEQKMLQESRKNLLRSSFSTTRLLKRTTYRLWKPTEREAPILLVLPVHRLVGRSQATDLTWWIS